MFLIPKEFVDSDKVVTPNKDVTPKEILSNIQKNHLVIQAYNHKDKNLMLTQLLTKLVYSVSEIGNHYFAIYHPHYKDKFNNLIRMFVLAADYLHSSCNLSNLLMALACTAKPGLVMKKEELPKTSLHLLFYQPPSQRSCKSAWQYLNIWQCPNMR